MYRFRISEIFLGCFLTVAVFGAGMLFNRQQAAQPQQIIKQQEGAAQGHKTEIPDAELTGSTWLTKDAAGFFTFGLVVVGIGQALLFFFQLRYMGRGLADAATAADAASDSARAANTANRAWLSLVSAEIISDLVRGKDGGWRITIKYALENSGRSFAHNVTCGVIPSNIPEILDEAESTKFGKAGELLQEEQFGEIDKVYQDRGNSLYFGVAPGAKIPFSNTNSRVRLSGNGIPNSDGVIVFYGGVRYITNGIHGETAFQFTLASKRAERGGHAGFGLSGDRISKDDLTLVRLYNGGSRLN